ncbi:hypothetical protein [Tenacibaculum aiptasiae]|uniref:hypothetical protein n=1 Tax=Tenacibaculum aiptasiae TaxID=426481 RepID=UPI003B5C404F
MKRSKIIILFILGLISISFSQILVHYFNISDLLKGVFIGFGIGLLITSIKFFNLNLQVKKQL